MRRPSRREFLAASAAAIAAGPATACLVTPPRLPAGSPFASAIPAHASSPVVNDIHSQLNRTHVGAIVKPGTVDELRAAVMQARAAGMPVAIAGGRHAMGGQQFVHGGVLIDTRALDRVIGFDPARGLVTVEGGIQWPALLRHLNESQRPDDPQWGIVQKQTGADRLSLAGALACNAHGRGLTLKPIVDQVEAFDLMDPNGEVRTCSRRMNADAFRLAIGGYGLFGVITRVTLRLRPRVKVRRVVELADVDGIIDRFDERIRDGYLYGDFQFATDASRSSFLRRGVFSCYQPVAPDTPLTVNPTRFHPEDWARLTFYTHTHKRRAFEVYSERYLQTSGQIYWGDSQLSAAYVDNYHAWLDDAVGARVKATEMITEIYVPRPKLAAFMDDASMSAALRRESVIYGTVRLVERDDDTFLAWAREPYACVIFNLHVEHTPEKLERAAEAFRELIDLGRAHGGSYYLTYHRWARRDQVEACYPQFPEFLRLKRAHDPGELFQSDWYRHYRAMFA